MENTPNKTVKTGASGLATETQEIENKSIAQQDYCKSRQIPMFAPKSGVCWSCGKQIYSKLSEKSCSSEHVTGCPFCCRSYCD